jgi:hypothetical protein
MLTLIIGSFLSSTEVNPVKSKNYFQSLSVFAIKAKRLLAEVQGLTSDLAVRADKADKRIRLFRQIRGQSLVLIVGAFAFITNCLTLINFIRCELNSAKYLTAL